MQAGNLTNVTDDQVDSLVHVLELIRSGSATTRPDIAHASGYGRTLISQRLAQLQDVGLVSGEEVRLGVRGRAPVVLRFAAERAYVLVAVVDTFTISAALSDLSGELVRIFVEERVAAAGLEEILESIERLFDSLTESVDGLPIWGIGVGLPAPVRYSTGRPAGSAITPLWEDFPVRDRLEARYAMPVWVDNDVNLMAFGESRTGGEDTSDIIYVRVAGGFGAGILSEGRLHRGATGAAGEIAHVQVDKQSTVRCYCGKTGCLVAVAGGPALIAAAETAIREGVSTALATSPRAHTNLTVEDIANAATHNDPLAMDLVYESARALGTVLADLVNFYNPAKILLGGPLAHSNHAYLAGVREEVFRRAHPLATRPLTIDEARFEESSGLRGAALMVVDEMLSRKGIARWINQGTPVGAFESLAFSN